MGRSGRRSSAPVARQDRRAPAGCKRSPCLQRPRVDQARTGRPARPDGPRRLRQGDGPDQRLLDHRDREPPGRGDDPGDRAQGTRGRAETTPWTSTRPGPERARMRRAGARDSLLRPMEVAIRATADGIGFGRLTSISRRTSQSARSYHLMFRVLRCRYRALFPHPTAAARGVVKAGRYAVLRDRRK